MQFVKAVWSEFELPEQAAFASAIVEQDLAHSGRAFVPKTRKDCAFAARGKRARMSGETRIVPVMVVSEGLC